MRNMLTIFRRDFTAYFTSPIGYIFMIVFLLISVGLYMTTFFAYPMADMRNFFSNLPILLCIFIPAVTMRVWAEERKENTWEMLLTFPMRARELVLGKFFTTLVFYALTLLSTVTVPLMLISLGKPDLGATCGGYLGALLLGAFFLSIGIFFSGFCKDQIVAFVVTLLVCFGLFLAGTDFVAMQIDEFFPGLGAWLSQTVGFIEHYSSFTRGVIEAGDVLYFLAWTMVFLALNMLYIEGRSRPKARFSFAVTLTLCVAIGLAFNWLITGQSVGRLDLTENKIYTVSQATKNILQSLKAPVQIKYYITPKDEMPASLATLEQDVQDKLEELKVASGGKLEYSVLNLRAANVIAKPEVMGEEKKEEKKDDSKALEERMLDKGVAPFSVQAMDEDQITQKLVYSSILVGYRDKPEEIIPQIVPQNLNELEYQLVNTIYKLTREKQPIIALVAPEDTVPEEMKQIYAQMGQPIPQSVDPYQRLMKWLQVEKYDVRRVSLTKDSPLPDEYDALVILYPRRLQERQRYEISRALASGKPVFLAVQNYEWDYRVTRNGTSVSRTDVEPGVNELLKEYGLSVSPDILMDVNNQAVNVRSEGGSLADLLGMGQPITLPIQMYQTSANMNPDTAVTNWLSEVLYFWGTAVTVDTDKLASLQLENRVLMHTTNRAWSVPFEGAQPDQLNQAINEALMRKPPEKGEQYPLMVMVEGQFPDLYKDKPRPAWAPSQPRPGMPPEPPDANEPAAAPITPAPGKLIVLGCAQLFNDNFVEYGNNRDMVLNSVDVMTLGPDLINVRGQKLVNRSIERPDKGARVFWKTINYAAVNLIIVGIGIVVALVRKQSRTAYTMSFNNKQ